MCSSIEERRISARWTWIGLAELRVVRNARKLKPKESLGGNDWSQKREDITINVYRFAPNQ